MTAQPLTNTSFDRFARYRYLLEIRRDHFPAGPLRVLDVGDPYGTLSAVLPDDETVSLDLFSEGAPTHGHRHVLGSGLELPFPDDAFDIVASHDTLEHLPAGTMVGFVSELLRVGRGPVVLVAPFSDLRTEACELLVNSYFVARTGHSLEPLDEHSEGGGLPVLEELTGGLDDLGVGHVESSGGWLGHWVAMMLFKAHFAAHSDIYSERRFDTAFNVRLRPRDDLTPHYRRVVIARPPAGLTFPGVAQDDSARVAADMAYLMNAGHRVAQRIVPGQPLDSPSSALREALASGAGAGDEDPVDTSLRELFDELDASARAPDQPRPPTPTVSVIVVAGNGAHDARRVAAALGDQVRAAGGAELLLVVPSAADAVPDLAAKSWVRFLVEPVDDFVLRVNRAAESSSRECLVFVDPGLEVGDDFLVGLMAGYRSTPDVACVGARVSGRPGPAAVASLRHDGDYMLYAPRQAMLVGCREYRGLGGFDGALGGVLDDVDFGWRLNIAGYRVVQAPVECCWRDPTPTSGPSLAAEAKALVRMAAKNLEPSNLWDVLGPDLVAAPPDLTVTAEDWGATMAARQDVQALRRSPDADVIGRFGRPGLPPPAGIDPGGLPGSRYRLRRLAPRVAVFGTTERAADLAGLLGDWVDVDWESLLSHRGGDATVSMPFAAAEAADVTVVDHHLASQLPGLLTASRAVIVDLGAEVAVTGVPPAVLRSAVAFVCGSERQREHWLGRLAAEGRRPRPAAHGRPLRGLVEVVPPAGEDPSRKPPYGQSGISAGHHRVLVDARGAGPVPWLNDEELALLGKSASTGQVVGWALPDDLDGYRAQAPRVAWEAAGPELDDRRWLMLFECRLVVRPVGDGWATRLGTCLPTMQALAARVPAVVSCHDPGAGVVAAHRAGRVTYSPADLVGSALALLADPVRWAGYEAGAQVATVWLRHHRLTTVRAVTAWAMAR